MCRRVCVNLKKKWDCHEILNVEQRTVIKKVGEETVNRFDYEINVSIISWIRNGIYAMKFSTINKRTTN